MPWESSHVALVEPRATADLRSAVCSGALGGLVAGSSFSRPTPAGPFPKLCLAYLLHSLGATFLLRGPHGSLVVFFHALHIGTKAFTQHRHVLEAAAWRGEPRHAEMQPSGAWWCGGRSAGPGNGVGVCQRGSVWSPGLPLCLCSLVTYKCVAGTSLAFPRASCFALTLPRAPRGP